MRVKVAAMLVLVGSVAAAQNAKETCPQASERGQRLLDERRLLEARNAFLSCAAESCPAAVKRDCQTQLDELKKNLPSIVIHVKDKDGSDVAHGSVSLDGTNIGELDGRVLEVDPGTHKLHVEVPGGRAFDRQIILAAGEHARDVTFDAKAPSSLGDGVPDVQFERKHDSASGGWTAVRTIGFIGMIAGGVSLVVSGLFVAVDVSNVTAAGTSNPNECGAQKDPAKCTAALNAAMNLDAPVALVTGLTGLALLGGGIVLFIVGGNNHAAAASWNITPMVGPQVAGLSLRASF